MKGTIQTSALSILALVALWGWFLLTAALSALFGAQLWPLVLLLRLALFLPLALGLRQPLVRGGSFGLAVLAGYAAFSQLSAAWPLMNLLYLFAVVLPLFAWWQRDSAVIDWRAVLDACGFRKASWPLVWLGLGVAALFAAPWVVVGALGSSSQVVNALGQAALLTICLEVLLRGVVFAALARSGMRLWQVALWSAACGALLGAGIADGIEAILLGALLGALRAVSGSLVPVLLLGFVMRAAPLLMIDPRIDFNLTLLLIHAALALFAVMLAFGLWFGRRWQGWKRRWQPLAGLALGLWLALAGAYTTLGAPGLNEDGFIIVLKEQADLTGAQEIADRLDRLRFVHQRLIAVAERTQAPLRQELDALGVTYRPYYLVNMIRVDGRPELQSQFANRPEVLRIDRNPNARAYRFLLANVAPETSEGPAIEPGLLQIGVQTAWDRGIRGAGVLVAGADTGYQWDHPALKAAYAGWDGTTVDHNYHWHDAWDDRAEPFDDDMHGTHTMGTMVGDDGLGNRIGAAPAARWIGCRNMRHGLGNPGAYTECMEYFLAPYPHGGDPFTDSDPSYAPMVVNNSWGCPDQEGCNPQTLQLAFDHLQAAGILMVVSAGNDGPSCSTVNTAPALYDSALVAGALRDDDPTTPEDESQTIASFSSRGPVTADNSGRIKPDLSAPGTMVRSSIPPRGYARTSGTSMASPHIAGAAALLISADPSLAGRPEAITQLLRQTAHPLLEATRSCGLAADVTPNNSYGAGEIDLAAALDALAAQP